MLSYWILRGADGRPIGLVRRENERVSLQLNTPVDADWMLFSDTDAVPLAADRTAVLADANALLGTKNGRTVAFAAARNAQPVACYRLRMSQNDTMQQEAPVPVAPEAPSSEPEPIIEASEPENAEKPGISEEEPPPDTVDGSAERTAQFSLLLERASAFYAQFEQPTVAAVDNMVQKEDNSEQTGGIDLFPQAFPRARWRYVDGADILTHYEGLMIGANGVRTRILAVRGRAAPRPPRALAGFTRYLRGSDGAGYWVKTE